MATKKHSGSKYIRTIYPVEGVGEPIQVDVYNVVTAFDVKCPARAHAIKKLLCSGIRGKGSPLQDLRETIDAVNRAIELQEQAERVAKCAAPLGTECKPIEFAEPLMAGSGELEVTFASMPCHRRNTGEMAAEDAKNGAMVIPQASVEPEVTPSPEVTFTNNLPFLGVPANSDAIIRPQSPRQTCEPMGAPRHYD